VLGEILERRLIATKHGGVCSPKRLVVGGIIVGFDDHLAPDQRDAHGGTLANAHGLGDIARDDDGHTAPNPRNPTMQTHFDIIRA
jgi:hypothetical protein